MSRFLTLALLATAAVPAVAVAQDNERARTGTERREAAVQRGDRGPRGERAPRAEGVAQPSAAAVAQPQVAAERTQRGGGDRRWQGNAPVAAPAVQAQAQTEWRAPPRSERGPELRDAGRRDTTGRGGEINRDRDARGDDRRGNDRRDWNDGRRDDNRGDWNNGQRGNDGRNWNGQRGNDGRGWNGGRNGGNWNRNWRSDNRYDWQRYRNSNRYAYRLPRYYAPSGWNYGYRRYSIGATLFVGLFAQDYWIQDPYSYRLPPVEWPYQWVRYYDDALLVDTRSGYVVDSIPGIFW